MKELLEECDNYMIFFNKLKWPATTAKLTVSHYDELFSLEDINEINYYIDISIKHNRSAKTLRLR